MRYRVTADSVVVASTVWGSGWQEINNGELLSVDRKSLQVSVCSIEGTQVSS